MPERMTGGECPCQLAYDDDKNYMWVTNFLTGNVTKFKAEKPQLGKKFGPYAVGENPYGIVYGTIVERVAKRKKTTTKHYIWVTNNKDGTVSKLNADNGTKAWAKDQSICPSPAGIAFDGEKLWVASDYPKNDKGKPVEGKVYRMDADTGKIIGSPITVGFNPISVLWDGEFIWVANSGPGPHGKQNGTVSKINTTTNKVDLTISSNVGKNPTGLALVEEEIKVRGITEIKKYIYVTNAGDGNLSAIDIATSAVSKIGKIKDYNSPFGLTSDKKDVWIVERGRKGSRGSRVFKRETKTGNRYPKSVKDRPMGVALSPTHIWVANFGDAAKGSLHGKTVSFIKR